MIYNEMILGKKYLIILSIIALFFFHEKNGSAQNLLIKAGIADYSDVLLFSQPDGYWKIGPIIGAGIEFNLNNGWFIQGTLEYSHNVYNTNPNYAESLELGHNNVFDVIINIKKKWGFFYLIGGLGYSFQKSTSTYAYYTYEGEFHRSTVYSASSRNVISGLLGIGLEFDFKNDWGIFIEGSFRGRHYTSSLAEIGIVIKL